MSNWYNDGLYLPGEGEPAGNNDGYFDGAQYAAAFGERQYCLAETVSPDGYQLLADPVLFRLTEAGTTVALDDADMNIVNIEDNLGNERR